MGCVPLSRDVMVSISNRFDGIDFPDDSSRMLILYNIPKITHLQERFLYSRMAASVLFSERIKTRIMQAVGRCTRNAKDYAVVLVGLLNWLITNMMTVNKWKTTFLLSILKEWKKILQSIEIQKNLKVK